MLLLLMAKCIMITFNVVGRSLLDEIICKFITFLCANFNHSHISLARSLVVVAVAVVVVATAAAFEIAACDML